MIRVGVVGHTGYAELPAVLRTLQELVPALGLDLHFEEELHAEAGYGQRLNDAAEMDAMLSLGGDGTLLRTARLLHLAPVPILGVNLGRLGFLTCCPADQLQSALMRFARGDFEAESRMALDARVVSRNGESCGQWFALNDVVVHKGGVARMVSLRVAANGEAVSTYSADGVVLSTPTGSTAYSLSAGGPVVAPTLETIIVTAVSAHTLAIRPLILPPDATVTITAEAEAEEEQLLVTVDGQVGTTFASGDTLHARRATGYVRIVRFPGASFFATMRRKLGWGGLAERDHTDTPS